MCRLFGFRSAIPSRPHRSLTMAENALATQSMAHPDGWGIGWFMDEDAYIVKSARPAHACERFNQVSSRLTSQTFIVHVRRATVGNIDSLNAHPFRFGRWLFAHNGTMFDFEKIRPWINEKTDPLFRSQILGDTDSEALFYYLLTMFSNHGICSSGRTASLVSDQSGVLRYALADLDRECQERGIHRPITNVLLTDGRSFIAHRAGMPLHLSTQKRSCPDEETCPAKTRVCLTQKRDSDQVNHLLVASERIGAENLWEEVSDGETVTLDKDFRMRVVPPPPGWIAPEMPEGWPNNASK